MKKELFLKNSKTNGNIFLFHNTANLLKFPFSKIISFKKKNFFFLFFSDCFREIIYNLLLRVFYRKTFNLLTKCLRLENLEHNKTLLEVVIYFINHYYLIPKNSLSSFLFERNIKSFFRGSNVTSIEFFFESLIKNQMVRNNELRLFLAYLDTKKYQKIVSIKADNNLLKKSFFLFNRINYTKNNQNLRGLILRFVNLLYLFYCKISNLYELSSWVSNSIALILVNGHKIELFWFYSKLSKKKRLFSNIDNYYQIFLQLYIHKKKNNESNYNKIFEPFDLNNDFIVFLRIFSIIMSNKIFYRNQNTLLNHIPNKFKIFKKTSILRLLIFSQRFFQKKYKNGLFFFLNNKFQKKNRIDKHFVLLIIYSFFIKNLKYEKTIIKNIENLCSFIKKKTKVFPSKLYIKKKKLLNQKGKIDILYRKKPYIFFLNLFSKELLFIFRLSFSKIFKKHTTILDLKKVNNNFVISKFKKNDKIWGIRHLIKTVFSNSIKKIFFKEKDFYETKFKHFTPLYNLLKIENKLNFGFIKNINSFVICVKKNKIHTNVTPFGKINNDTILINKNKSFFFNVRKLILNYKKKNFKIKEMMYFVKNFYLFFLEYSKNSNLYFKFKTLLIDSIYFRNSKLKTILLNILPPKIFEK